MVKALLTLFYQISRKNWILRCVIPGHEILVFGPGGAENLKLRLPKLFFVILWTITLQNCPFWRPSLHFDFFHPKNGPVPISQECPYSWPIEPMRPNKYFLSHTPSHFSKFLFMPPHSHPFSLTSPTTQQYIALMHNRLTGNIVFHRPRLYSWLLLNRLYSLCTPPYTVAKLVWRVDIICGLMAAV